MGRHKILREKNSKAGKDNWVEVLVWWSWWHTEFSRTMEPQGLPLTFLTGSCPKTTEGALQQLVGMLALSLPARNPS